MAIRLSFRLSSLLLVCCAGAMLSGCARMGALSRVDPVSVAVYPGGRNASEPAPTSAGTNDCRLVRGVNSYSGGAINLDCFRFPEDWPATDTAEAQRNATARQAAVDEIRPPVRGETPPTRTEPSMRPLLAYARAVRSDRDRNRLTALLLKHSDDICVEEMGRLNSNESAVNTGLSILGTAATTTANIVTGELAQSILTGAGTLAGASRSHINAHVYRNTFAYAVSRAITLERRRLRDAIEKHHDETTTEYTVDEAIQAVNEYHGACSFYKGLELVLASVEGDQRSRDAQARQAQIDAINLEIAQQTGVMNTLPATPPTIRAPYIARLEALSARKQELILGPAQPRPPGG